MHPKLKAYIPMADMLAATFGDECEVVLHDIADPE
ncbi:MAG: PAS domain-containing protein, partial [Selenomonas sp.]|nr:PAS domain-containing protein [Selenomonas sp.]